MFQVKSAELDLTQLGKVISIFMTRDLPKLERYHHYYLGKHLIMGKCATDVGKPCNRVMVNYCNNIADSFSGYMTGIDISYSSDTNIEAVQDILNYNDVHSEDTELLKTALIFGRACEINYIDEEGQQRFKVLDPRECFPIYDDTLNQNLLYAVRLYKDELIDGDAYMVEVYDATTRRKYKSTLGFSSFELLEEVPHYYGQVPVTFFSLNKEETSIFDQIMSLNDAYNELISDEVDAFQAWSDAYLVLKGVTADEDDLVSMKQNRVLMIDQDDDATYLTKSVNDTQIENMLNNINSQIHKIAACPDFSQESFGTSSGIALRFRLLNFENKAGAIESQMRKALQKRIELICSIANLTGSETVWRDIQITFTRNLPVNVDEIAEIVNKLRGLVSDETLLAQLPFITDPKAELDRLAAQKEENMAMYSFATGNEEEEEEVNE